MTPVVANLVLAGSSIETGLVSALVDVGVTSLPLPAGITVAGPVIDLVPAPTSVTAGILKQQSPDHHHCLATGQTNLELATFVNVNFAIFPLVARLTDTPDVIDEIHTAAVVLTRGLIIRGMLESPWL